MTTITAFAFLVVLLAGCAGDPGIPEAAPLELTAEEVAEWDDERKQERVNELEEELSNLDAYRENIVAELDLIVPSDWVDRSHFGYVTVTDRSCVETADSGFSDILTMQPIIRDGTGSALGTFIPLPPRNIGSDCEVPFATSVEDIDELPLYEIDMGRRGDFVVTDSDLAVQDMNGVQVSEWFRLTIG